MPALPIGSREYKVMLDRSRFHGSQNHLLSQAGAFWNDFRHCAAPHVLDTDGSLDKIKKERSIQFRDSPGKTLRSIGYVFRERSNLAGGPAELTLKFRHADRYISQGRDMRSADAVEGDVKFEEDIKSRTQTPFRSLYSHSSKRIPDSPSRLDTLADLTTHFPDLGRRLDVEALQQPLGIVGETTAREIVIGGADFEIARNPKLEAKCALIVWHDTHGSDTNPLTVEFSFRYKNRSGDFPPDAAARAYQVFTRIQTALSSWIDPDAPTKTALIYQGPAPG